MSIIDSNWSGLTWSDWVGFSDTERVKSVTTSPGIYRIKQEFSNISTKPTYQESPYVFVSERLGKLAARALNNMFDVYLERCDCWNGQQCCHSLRHTFCKDLANRGVPIEQINEFAGHDSIQTTAIYVQSSGHDLRKAVNRI